MINGIQNMEVYIVWNLEVFMSMKSLRKGIKTKLCGTINIGGS
jgi:hypothetical protein